jgi:hypothetical protein
LFRAGAKVRNEVADSAVVEIMKELNQMYTNKVTEQELKTVKASYVGNFVMNVEKPETVARYALNIERNDLPEDFYENYLANINAVTADDVMRVVKKYFNKDNIRITVTSKGSEVVPALEKLDYPMYYFDKTGQPSEKPKMPEAVGDDVTPERVVQAYFDAIGGLDKLKSVTSLEQTGTMNMQGMSLESTIKMEAPNKMLQEVEMSGMTAFKMVFDGNQGYMEQMGQKQEIPADQLEELQQRKGVISDLDLLESEAVLQVEGIYPVGGKEAYKLSITKENQVTYKYYDTESGLLLREESSSEGPDGNPVVTTTDYEEYKEVGGILVAHKQVSVNSFQTIERVTKEVKINPTFEEGTFE